jgi:hypothetical protein
VAQHLLDRGGVAVLVVGRPQDASCSGCSSRATVPSAIMLALFLCPAIRKSWARAASSLGVISPVLTRSDICVSRSSPGFASLAHQAADAVKHSRFRAPTPARSWVPAALLYGLALPSQAKSSQLRTASACQGTPSRTL